MFNVGTLITLVVLLVIVILAVRSMVKDKKQGKSIQCGMNCQKCNGHCSK